MVLYCAPPWHAEVVGKVCSEQVFANRVEADKGEHRSISLVQDKTTFIDPLLQMEASVPVCRIEQKPSTFILTATRGYHCGFNWSFNIAEAVKHADVQWFTKHSVK